MQMRVLVLLVGLLGSIGAVNAACPSIEGDWAMAFDEVYLGNQIAGIGRAEITDSKIKLRLREAYLGIDDINTFTGNYSIQSNCMVTWNYTQRDGLGEGTIHGIIVSEDKIFFMVTNPVVQSTGRIVAERIKYDD